jgi:ribosomal protein S18 acetylase RimI-like enzyme
MKLMRGFVDWCMNEKGALSVQGGDIANIQSVGVDALYRRMGFARLGVIYKYVRK